MPPHFIYLQPFLPPSLLYVLRSQPSLCSGASFIGDPWSLDLPLHYPPDEERTHHPDPHLYVRLPGCCYAAGERLISSVPDAHHRTYTVPC